MRTRCGPLGLGSCITTDPSACSIVASEDYSQNTVELNDSCIVETVKGLNDQMPGKFQVAESQLQLYSMAMENESHCGSEVGSQCLKLLQDRRPGKAANSACRNNLEGRGSTRPSRGNVFQVDTRKKVSMAI